MFIRHLFSLFLHDAPLYYIIMYLPRYGNIYSSPKFSSIMGSEASWSSIVSFFVNAHLFHLDIDLRGELLTHKPHEYLDILKTCQKFSKVAF